MRRGSTCRGEDEVTVIVKSAADLVVPRSVRRRAGDRLEFKVSGGVITYRSKAAVRGRRIHTRAA